MSVARVAIDEAPTVVDRRRRGGFDDRWHYRSDRLRRKLGPRRRDLRLAGPAPSVLPVQPPAARQMAALPAGPLAPPPVAGPTRDGEPARPPGRAPRPGRAAVSASTASAAVPAATAPQVVTAAVQPGGAALTDAEPFVWIHGADEIEHGLGLRIVRVQLPRMRWDAATPRPDLVRQG